MKSLEFDVDLLAHKVMGNKKPIRFDEMIKRTSMQQLFLRKDRLALGEERPLGAQSTNLFQILEKISATEFISKPWPKFLGLEEKLSLPEKFERDVLLRAEERIGEHMHLTREDLIKLCQTAIECVRMYSHSIGQEQLTDEFKKMVTLPSWHQTLVTLHEQGLISNPYTTIDYGGTPQELVLIRKVIKAAHAVADKVLGWTALQ